LSQSPDIFSPTYSENPFYKSSNSQVAGPEGPIPPLDTILSRVLPTLISTTYVSLKSILLISSLFV